MLKKKPLIISLAFHAALFCFLVFGWPAPRAKENPVVFSAKMMFRNKPKALDYMPRKIAKVEQRAPEQAQAKKISEESKKDMVPPSKKAVASKPGTKIDYSKELARLTKNFKNDIAATLSEEAEEPITVIEDDGTYFEQIYYLIKQSFVVPSHVNGPQGKNLQAVLRLFLSPDGNLSLVKLEHSSGDEHFDRAVIDGTRRVNNFGAVPLALQSTLSKEGIVVEMCPFTCVERRGG